MIIDTKSLVSDSSFFPRECESWSVLSSPQLVLLFRCHIFTKHINGILVLPFNNIRRVPQLRSNTKILEENESRNISEEDKNLAATHQSI